MKVVWLIKEAGHWKQELHLTSGSSFANNQFGELGGSFDLLWPYIFFGVNEGLGSDL